MIATVKAVSEPFDKGEKLPALFGGLGPFLGRLYPFLGGLGHHFS